LEDAGNFAAGMLRLERVSGKALDRYARNARQFERVDEPLDPPFLDPGSKLGVSSLLSKENTRNFANFGPAEIFLAPKNPHPRSVFSANCREQRTGNLARPFREPNHENRELIRRIRGRWLYGKICRVRLARAQQLRMIWPVLDARALQFDSRPRFKDGSTPRVLVGS
jgi:hypothetical protein